MRIIKLTLIFVFITQESAEEDGWHHLVAKGFIEYIDTEEEETTMISMTISVSNEMKMWLNEFVVH